MDPVNRPASSSASSDSSFEDAQDLTPRPYGATKHRSLTNNSSDTPTIAVPTKKASPKPVTIPAAFASASADDSTPTSHTSSNKTLKAKKAEHTAEAVSEAPPPPPKDSQSNKSSPFSSPSISPLDDVQLNDEASEGPKDTSQKQAHPSISTASSSVPPPLPPKNEPRTAPTSLPQGLASFPPPSPPQRPTAPTRKLTNAFSWLRRDTTTTTTDRKASSTSPPLPPTPPSYQQGRRGTSSSRASISSNPDLMLDKFHNEGESEHSYTNRNSLKDRFRLVRLQQENGLNLPNDGTPMGASLAAGRSASVGLGVLGTEVDEKDAAAPSISRSASVPGPLPHSQGPPPLLRQATVQLNLKLAPGTAAGFTSGPTPDITEPVDWDLWQAVVYEGPAAVVRSSPEDLNKAIASGIPQAIRGVIWQVLAQSKNEDLEGVYRDLVARGTDKEQPVAFRLPRFRKKSDTTSQPKDKKGQEDTTDNATEKESIASSASSIHSDYSTPATTGQNSSPTTTTEVEADVNLTKLRANMAAEAKKRAAEEAQTVSKLEKVIKRDLGSRTSYSKYLVAAGLQDALFGVCKAYALFDTEVGYAQGMNFIIMPLLFNMPEEEAFCLLVRLMNKYGLRNLFIQDMPGLHLHLYQFERLLEEFEPAVYCHLHRRGVTPQLYATQWFLTLFAYRFPLQLVLRIYDLILSEGLEGAILKFGLVLMQRNAAALLAMNDMTQLSNFLKEKLFDVYIDKAPSSSSLLESGFFGSTAGIDKEVYRADMLVQDACNIKITPEMLKTYANEWHEKQRVEKERTTELEGLKFSVTSLKDKVRVMEERAEKSDQEHVKMASDLVRSKVQIEDLDDESETLKTRVAELQRIVDSQPEEVEQRLRTEMESVMQRNIEVHNENRALEDQMTEMERELVETKMQYAEICSDYETLKQKWSTVSAMLNSQSFTPPASS